MRATTDEVDDLETVAVLQLGAFPMRARHDLAIEFDGHAISLHSELLDELGQRGRVGTGFRFAIYEELHERNVSQGAIRLQVVD
jgi:hypothetical protein